MAYLAILQPDARVAARITAALGTAHRAVVLRSWPELEHLLDSEAVDGCVLDVDDPDREEALARMARLRSAHPRLAILAFVDFEGPDIELFRLGGIGIDGILSTRSVQGPAGIRQAIEHALVLARAERIRRALRAKHGDAGADAMAWAVEHATEKPSVATFAAAMGRSPRALAKALSAAGLPPPSRALLQGRLMLAGAFLGADGRTVEETAFLLGYSTANALARAMKREVGHTPPEVARRGGMSFVQEILFPERVTRRGAARRRVLHGAAVAACFVSLHAPQVRPNPAGGHVDARAIDRVLDASPLNRVHFGVLAVDAASGRVLYSRDAGETFIPASNDKLLTAATALSLLGPDYRFRTTLWSAATLSSDTLDGDLVLVGTGDPSLSDPTWKDGQAALEALADSLRAAGVRYVTGSLVVDVSAWDSTSVPGTWEASDLWHGYGATPSAFTIDDGALTLIATGTSEGEPATLTWFPHGTRGFVSTDVTTGPPDSATHVTASWLPESRRLTLAGSVRPGETDTLSFALRDPVGQATAVLARALAGAGIQVAGGSRVVWEPGAPLGGACLAGEMATCPGARPLASLRSPPLSDILAIMLGESQNWIAEQLVRTLGTAFGGRGSTSRGLDVVARFVTQQVGVEPLDLLLYDGSGLSMHDLVTPRAIVHILRYMRAGPDGDAYRDALARPGEKRSTLEDRLESLRGRLFAKTGTLTGVNSLSGYLVTSHGREMIFSILSNGSSLPSQTVQDAIDQVVHILAR